MISKFIKDHNTLDIRVTYGNAWLIWATDQWRVYCRPPYGKKTLLMYEGVDEQKAIVALIKYENCID